MLRYSASQLFRINHFTTPPLCLSVIEYLGLLRVGRPRYVHRGSKRGFVYTGSADTIPTVWSRRPVTAHLRHHNKPHVCSVNLKPLACVDGITVLPAIATYNNSHTFMLLNTRSLNNKASLINEIIIDRKLDFLCLTETWQNQQDFLTLNLATPPRLCLSPTAPLHWSWWWAGSHPQSRYPCQTAACDE